MSGTHHMSKKSKLSDDLGSPQVMIDGYIGHEPVHNATHIRFHPSVVFVNYGAFRDCDQLIEVILNNGLREIGQSAFRYCTALQSINIPSTVIEIGNGAFYGCKLLQSINIPSTVEEIGKDSFYGCTSLQEITIPSTVTKIGSCAFHDCTELKEVVLNKGLMEVDHRAFANCKALQSITIPSTVTEIGTTVFMDCQNLRDVVLKEGVQRIKFCAFGRCNSLASITIPSTVIEIGKAAFDYCIRLREVVLHNEKVQIEETSFEGCTSLERFKFPSLWTRLVNIIQAGQRGIEPKLDNIPAVEWRGGELIIPAVSREIEDDGWGMVTVVKVNKEKLNKIVSLIRYYEIKEAATLFELALWKSTIDQAEISNPPVDRGAYRVDVPGPVKDTILQYHYDEGMRVYIYNNQ